MSVVTEPVAGRAYARVYTTSGRADLHAYLLEAVARSGARMLYASSAARAPVYLGVQTSADERVGVLAYPFRATHRLIRNRPADEHRLQVRYGAESTWGGEHPLGRDIASVDTTVVLGVHLEADLLVGVDPMLYDPLPMGISVEFKNAEVNEARASGWHVFERDNIAGRRRSPRAPRALETIVIFRPERLLDYVRFEREATDLGLDPALRYAAAETAAVRPGAAGGLVGSLHRLEEQFAMSSAEILDMISSRNRLAVAVRGGVAEHHLERALRDDERVGQVERFDADAQPDFAVRLRDGRRLLVECKNCSPARYANGDIKVEVQKTRATQGDPAGRLYRPDQFDVVAACLYPPTRQWTFAFQAMDELARDRRFPDRLAPLHRVTDQWPRAVADVT
jgi:hypothetical protein